MKRINDTLKLNIHKYNNYNIIEIYLNRLITTTQIFIAMDYLTTENSKRMCQGNLSHPVEVTESVYISKICTKT